MTKAEQRIQRIKALSLREQEGEQELARLKVEAKEAKQRWLDSKQDLRNEIAQDMPLLEQEPAA